jgi:hypothetical protein
MHGINSRQSRKEIIGPIVQGFTCLAAQTAQSPAIAGLEGCSTPVCLN